ncbi:hypothetical protein VTL71DRAFT_5760 [Oculimacula yallundae]|uniref:Uncharacterized protein n=1 Tax=Oculimacula yallundae TaxID=86028 RepID=A0ABR4BYH0_9HELO
MDSRSTLPESSAEISKAIQILSNENLPNELRNMILEHYIESHILSHMNTSLPFMKALTIYQRQANPPIKHLVLESTRRDYIYFDPSKTSKTSNTGSYDFGDTRRSVYMHPSQNKKTLTYNFGTLRLRLRTICSDNSDSWSSYCSAPGDVFHQIVSAAFAGGKLERIVIREQQLFAYHLSRTATLQKEELDKMFGVVSQISHEPDHENIGDWMWRGPYKCPSKVG